MRVSTQVLFQRNVDSVLGHQSKLSQQNIHLSSQKRVIYGSDDAVAISTIQRLKQDISMGEQYLSNGHMADTANGLEETALSQVTNILQRVRELIVTAGNDTHNAENRETVAKELEGLHQELLGVANTRDGNSQFIFSGYQVDTQPFQKNEFGGVDYHGDGGEKFYKIGTGVLVQGNDAGSSVFSAIAEGNGTFVSEGGTNNTGSGVISEGSVIDKRASAGFTEQDYTIAITEPSAGADPEYSVYGLDDTAVTGNANVRIGQIDPSDPNFNLVNPSGVYPDAASDVSINFAETAPNSGMFALTINGQAGTPAAIYDSSDTTMQTLMVNGISVEVDGIPNDADQYTMTKYVEPTLYVEGQSIEFNGIKTEIKGNVNNLDSFTLRQSDEKDIFTTIQDTINILRIPGEDGIAKSQRTMGMAMVHLQVDSAMSNVSGVVTSIGARMRTIENQSESTQDFNLTNQKSLSNLEDLDMASAISEFKLQMSQLEVSQQTFIQIQSLSLFKLI